VVRTLLITSAVLLATGCASTLRITRGVPPLADLGPDRTLALDVRTNQGDRAVNAVFSTLTGSLAIPADLESTLSAKVVEHLTNQVGVRVCSPAPCGVGTLKLVLTESSLGLEQGRAVGKVTIRVALDVAGSVTYRDTIWSRQSDTLDGAPMLLERASDAVAKVLARAFMPGQVTVEMPVEDDGALKPASQRLLSGNLEAAESLLNEVAAQEPGNAGAFYDLGLISEVRGDFARAAAMYREAANRQGKKRYFEAADSADRDAARYAPRP